MLILPKGYADFQKKVHDFTPGHLDGRKLRREVGFQTTKEPERESIKQYKAWMLPRNFCVDCGRNDITPKRAEDGTLRVNPGITELEEPMPEIGLTIGDVIWTWICHACMDSENWASANIQGREDQRVYYAKTHERRERQAIEWIKNAILRGDKPMEGRR